MKMETSTPEVAKKLWNIVRIVFFMVGKGISKSRILVDLHLILKRGNKLAGKAIGNLVFFHHQHLQNHHNRVASSLSCRSDEALSFVSPREYEFSCSNSPAIFSTAPKRHHHHRHRRRHLAKSYKYEDVTTVAAVQKMLEMLNKEVAADSASSPLTTTLPGFGKSPLVRQLRVTDSPFPIKDDGGDNHHVDKAAEEFIKMFYKDLNLQKKRASIESPYHELWGRW